MLAAERSVAGAPVAARIAASTGLSGWSASATARLIAAPTSSASTATRRDEEGDHGVDARVGEDQRQRRLEVLGGRRAEHVDGVRDGRLGREGGRERRAGRARRAAAARARPPRRRRRRGSRARRRSSARRRGALAGRAGRRASAATSSRPAERVGADHARLAEDRIDGGVRAGERRRVRAGGLLAGAGAAALHRQHRLLAGESARDARELARVAERLDVEQDEVGVRVVLPPLEQVVRGDVGLVADRDEGREPEPARLGALEQREAECARLRGEPDPARREGARREGRVQADGRGRDAEAVRADEPRSVRADEGEQLLLALDRPRARSRRSRPR